MSISLYIYVQRETHTHTHILFLTITLWHSYCAKEETEEQRISIAEPRFHPRCVCSLLHTASWPITYTQEPMGLNQGQRHWTEGGASQKHYIPPQGFLQIILNQEYTEV